jgi:hypothetical protein
MAEIVKITGIYDNLRFNPLIGSITGEWEAFIQNSDGTWRIVVRVSDVETGAPLATSENVFGVVNTESNYQGSYAKTFTIEAGSDFPVRARFDVSLDRRGLAWIGEDTQSFIVDFTGTQPEAPPPDTTMVDVSLTEPSYADNLLQFKINATKTSTFPPNFDFDGMKVIFNIKSGTGEQLKAGEVPFVFGQSTTYVQPFTFNNLVSNIAEVTFAVWNDDNTALSLTGFEAILSDTSPPEPPEPEQAVFIAVKAEDGAIIDGVVSLADFNQLSNPDFGVSTLNGVIEASQQTNQIPDTTATQIMDFLANHLITTPPPECPAGYHKENLNCVADDQQNPPTDAKFCESCQIWILGSEDCATCQPPEPPEPPPNVCFDVKFPNDIILSFTLLPDDFDALINNPISDKYVIINSRDCTGITPNTLTEVIESIEFQLDQLPDDTVSKSMVVQIPSNFIIKDDRVTGGIAFNATSSFNPFWYGKTIKSWIVGTSTDGKVAFAKLNDLNFTATEKDEFINLDESAGGNTVILAELFVIVSESDTREFSEPFQLRIDEQGSDDTTPKKRGKFFGALIGLLGGSLALSLLANEDKRK